MRISSNIYIQPWTRDIKFCHLQSNMTFCGSKRGGKLKSNMKWFYATGWVHWLTREIFKGFFFHSETHVCIVQSINTINYSMLPYLHENLTSRPRVVSLHVKKKHGTSLLSSSHLQGKKDTLQLLHCLSQFKQPWLMN